MADYDSLPQHDSPSHASLPCLRESYGPHPGLRDSQQSVHDRDPSADPGSPFLGMSRSSSHHSQDEHYRHLRHPNPNPDVQAGQGAYVANVERLEGEAERISQPASDIAEEIKKMREEQKARESRSSTMYSRRAASGDDSQSPVARQFSYEHGSHASNSVIGTNMIARSGGYSPAAYVGSPRGSMLSGSWEQITNTRSRHNSHTQPQPVRLAQLISEQLLEQGLTGAHTVSNSLEQGSQAKTSTPSKPTSGSEMKSKNGDSGSVSAGNGERFPKDTTTSIVDVPTDPERPSTHASTDTFEKTKDLFENFDGVHTQDQMSGPLTHEPAENRGETPILPQFADRRMSTPDAPPLEEMVYYPAPVPAMINLPQRLSRFPAAPERDKRRTQFLNTLEPTPQSAAWPQSPLFPGSAKDDHRGSPLQNETDKHHNLADLPPQLRASMYFDYPTAQQDVQLKDGSAVKTLDSILDASASLPVTAFTDHPFIGKGGADVYNRPPNLVPTVSEGVARRRSSSLNLLRRSSKSNLLQSAEPRKSSFLSLARIGRDAISKSDTEATSPHTKPENASLQHGEATWEVDDGGERDQDGEYDDADEAQIGPDAQEDLDEANQPATLLGELELRKRQQKQRNRTAGKAPNGMHATLLQHDAVAQLQKTSREKHKVTLAWEDAPTHDKENEDNEDVPLAMLYPYRKTGRRQPMGMIARREMEDNEPLSHRRARLRGEDPLVAQRKRAFQHQLSRSPSNNVLDESPNHDDETLGQRRERLRREKEADFRPASGDFANEVLGQLNGFEVSEHPAPSKTPEGLEEETLGQRRKRLQAEQRSREVSGNGSVMAPTETPMITKRRSMADILHAHPTAPPRIISNGSGRNHIFAPAGPTQRQTSWSQQVNQSSLTAGLSAMANGSTRQYDMVDRWRQSIQG